MKMNQQNKKTVGIAQVAIASMILVVLFIMPLAEAQTIVNPGDYKPHSKPFEPKNRADPTQFPERGIPETATDDPLVEKKLVGVRFVTVQDEIIEGPYSKEGFEFVNLKMLDTEEFRKTLSQYKGKAISWKLIHTIIRDTIVYYRSKNYPVVDVFPADKGDITDGVLQLIVIEAKVGEITVEGLNWFDEEYIRGMIQVKEGDPLNAKDLADDFDYINRNPFVFTRPILQPGRAYGTTDIIVDGKDKLPIRFYGGYDNTGSRSTGLDRFFAGVNFGDLFGKGHEAGYQYTTNKNFSSLGIHSAYWRIPLPNRDKIAFFGNFSQYNTASGGKLNSRNWMAHFRYISSLPSSYNLRHEIEFGLDFRRLDNTLRTAGTTVYDDYIDVAQLAFQYGGRYKDRLGDTIWTANVYAAPCSDLLSSHQNNKKYQAVRVGSQATYVYTHINIERTWLLKNNWSIFNRITGQAASERLTPSEQLGMGGYNRVRGYDDFEVLADSGLMATIELRTPEMPLGAIDKEGKLKHYLQLLSFCDWGWARNRGNYSTDAYKSVDMLSAGLGFRYRINNNLHVRFDYGWQLETIHNGRANDGRCHISVILSY